MRMRDEKISMPDILENPAYKGKHIILVAGKIFTARTGTEAIKILEKARKEHPKAIPQVAYSPKGSSLTV